LVAFLTSVAAVSAIVSCVDTRLESDQLVRAHWLCTGMEDRIVKARQTKRHRLSDNLCFLSRHKPWPGSKYALVGQKIFFYQ
jgi:hypothetical protein